MRRAVLTSLSVIFLLLVVVLHRPDTSGPLVRTRVLMGTVVDIRVYDDDAGRFEDAVTAAFSEMARIENLMSPHIPESDVSRLSAARSALAVSPETLAVLELALDVSGRSSGAFDPGIGRLVRLWGFADGEPNLPGPVEIEHALTGIGPHSVQISDGQVVKSSPAIEVDLGGIAKGYAIDRAAALLVERGVRHASVNAGGDMRLIGDMSGRPWRIGVQHPRRPDRVVATLALADRAVFTSGDYERYFIRDDIRYHHILDPKTGYPARGCQSVTVIADQAALADALATAAFVLGPDQGIDFLRGTPGIAGLIIAADGRRLTAGPLDGIVEWQ